MQVKKKAAASTISKSQSPKKSDAPKKAQNKKDNKENSKASEAGNLKKKSPAKSQKGQAKQPEKA